MGRSKAEKRLRLKQLEKAVGKWVEGLPRVGKGNPEVDTSKLTPAERKILRAHDQCCWNNILEDLDDEVK